MAFLGRPCYNIHERYLFDIFFFIFFSFFLGEHTPDRVCFLTIGDYDREVLWKN